MVTVEESADGNRQIILRPNIAVNWRQTLLAYALIAATSLGTAIVLSFRGLWPILLFAGATIWVLGWALYVSAHRSNEWEAVLIQGDRIEIQKGRRRAEYSLTLQTYWTEVALEPAGHRWYPSRLLLRSHGVAIEVGQFLHDKERAALARQLARWVGPMARSGERA